MRDPMRRRFTKIEHQPLNTNSPPEANLNLLSSTAPPFTARLARFARGIRGSSFPQRSPRTSSGRLGKKVQSCFSSSFIYVCGFGQGFTGASIVTVCLYGLPLSLSLLHARAFIFAWAVPLCMPVGTRVLGAGPDSDVHCDVFKMFTQVFCHNPKP